MGVVRLQHSAFALSFQLQHTGGRRDPMRWVNLLSTNLRLRFMVAVSVSLAGGHGPRHHPPPPALVAGLPPPAQRLYLTMAVVGTRLYFLAGYQVPTGDDSFKTVSLVHNFDISATPGLVTPWSSFQPTMDQKDVEEVRKELAIFYNFTAELTTSSSVCHLV